MVLYGMVHKYFGITTQTIVIMIMQVGYRKVQ